MAAVVKNDVEQRTEISYLYRDASNYKKTTTVVINGRVTVEQIKTVLECLDEGMYFIPNQIGFPENRFEEADFAVDHCWFEMDEYSFKLTNEPATMQLTPDDVVKLFLKKKDNWNGADTSWFDR